MTKKNQLRKNNRTLDEKDRKQEEPGNHPRDPANKGIQKKKKIQISRKKKTAQLGRLLDNKQPQKKSEPSKKPAEQKTIEKGYVKVGKVIGGAIIYEKGTSTSKPLRKKSTKRRKSRIQINKPGQTSVPA